MAVPYYATTTFRFTAPDLNNDLFNEFAKKEHFGSDKKSYFTNKIENQDTFVFKVE